MKIESGATCNNYRPISLLPTVGKVLKKLIHKRLHRFLESQNSFYPAWFDFRLNVSTSTALILITENIQTQFDQGKYCAGVFVNRKKPLIQSIIIVTLRKLDFYGIRGMANEWFYSYWNKRKQFVKILIGFPQGSDFGPLLLHIYINYLQKSIKYS